ncbi:MAG: hypothetical protein Q4C12_06900, partial [Clostridia bacterium]|nr:hypothetical protein [Clostridia bacterium]
MNVVLVGTNHVTDYNGENDLHTGVAVPKSAYSHGVYVDGALNISGTGTLNAASADANKGSYGIMCRGNITVSGGTVNTIGAEAEYNSYGIMCWGSITILGGTVNAVGTEAGDTFYSYGIMCQGSISISGGTLSAKSTSKNTKVIISAMNKAPDLSGYSGCTALASESADIEPTKLYNPADHDSYKYIKIQTLYDVWVGGVRITSENTGGVTGAGITGAVSYAPDTKTLTLNNATISESFFLPPDTSAAIYADSDLNIALVGTNNVTNYNSAVGGYNYAVSVIGALSISGDGTMNASADATVVSYGIMGWDGITILGGTVNATAAEAEHASYGIFSGGSITILGGTVSAKSTSTTATAVAMNKAPDLSDYSGCTALASESADIEPTKLYNPADHDSYKYIKIQTLYDVWVGGVRITSENTGGVTGAGITGAVSYAPDTK